LAVAEVLVGTSGWSYKEWVGPFYPPRTAASRMLALYAERLPTVEAHNTFRRRPRASTLSGWSGQVPPSFRFAPKAHVGITHQRELDGVEARVEAFFASLAPLGALLGPVLFQLPHRQPDLDRLDRLLAALPATPAAAFELGPAWNTAEVLDRLDGAGATLVIVDKDGEDALVPDAGAVAYVRLRRERYDDEAVARWASRLEDVARAGRPVFAYLRHEGDPLEAVRLLDAVRA
jgi:uncharacterized protein YecE (DUF72 family)